MQIKPALASALFVVLLTSPLLALRGDGQRFAASEGGFNNEMGRRQHEQLHQEMGTMQSHDPSRFTYLRLYCTSDGNSHFQDVTVELPKIDFAPPAAPIHIGGNVAASSAFFGGFEAGWGAHDLDSGLCHPAPAAQFIVVLQGDFSVIATDGETRQFRPGDVFRVEDIPPCKGHITVAGDKPGFFLFAR
jgi:hypothetical protein